MDVTVAGPPPAGSVDQEAALLIQSQGTKVWRRKHVFRVLCTRPVCAPAFVPRMYSSPLDAGARALFTPVWVRLPQSPAAAALRPEPKLQTE